MRHNITYLKDIFLSNYLGVEIARTEIQPFLNQLKDILGDSYDEYVGNCDKLNSGQFNIEVISKTEYQQLSKEIGLDKFVNSLDAILKANIDDIKILGIGKVQKDSNTSYFVVVSSDLLSEVRRKYNLPERDFYITLGFKYKDVEGVRKNQVMKPDSNFLKILKSKYLKEGESFEFIKGLKNFDGDFYKLIEPIKINDTNAIFRTGTDYFQVSLVDDLLHITGRWQDEVDNPILSEKIVRQKLKIN